jgi:hypothetical protein
MRSQNIRISKSFQKLKISIKNHTMFILTTKQAAKNNFSFKKEMQFKKQNQKFKNFKLISKNNF